MVNEGSWGLEIKFVARRWCWWSSFKCIFKHLDSTSECSQSRLCTATWASALQLEKCLCTGSEAERMYPLKYRSTGRILCGSTSCPMTQMFLWTWGTHCLSTANSSGMVVLGSTRTSLHCGSRGSKKENSKSCEKERQKGAGYLNSEVIYFDRRMLNFWFGSFRWI